MMETTPIMETKVITISLALKTLKKTIAANENSSDLEVAKFWIEKLSSIDENFKFNFIKPSTENRFWFLMNTQKEHILSQLQKITQTNSTTELPVITPEDKITLPEITPPEILEVIQSAEADQMEEVMPESQPAIIDTGHIELIIVPAEEISEATEEDLESFTTVQEQETSSPATVESPLIVDLKTLENIDSDTTPAIKNEKPATHIDLPAFLIETSKQLDLMTTQMDELRQQVTLVVNYMATIDSSITDKLTDIFTTVCSTANNTETMSAMYSSLSPVTTHKPEFTQRG